MKTQITIFTLIIILIRTSSAQDFNLIFTQDSVDAVNPGLYLYSYYPSFLAMDNGSGKKAFITANHNEDAGTMTTEYYSAGTFSKKLSIFEDNITGSSNLGMRGRFVQTVNCQITGDDQLEHVILYGTTSPQVETGSTYIVVKDSYIGTVLFEGSIFREGTTYFIADQFRKGKDQFDLTGNGYYEIICPTPLGSGWGYKIYIYDNLTLIDSIEDQRAGFVNKFGTTHDINNDGIPEISFSSNTDVNFYQWENSKQKFELLGGIPGVKSMIREPADVDGDGKKEIITQGGFWLGDSLYVYDSNFNIKYKIATPTIGSYGIKRYFTANVNDSPNDEIILVTTFLNMNDFSQTGGTAIYDLSVNTTTPIYVDSTFEVFDISNFKNDGKTHMLGLKSLKSPNFMKLRNSFAMKKFNGGTFDQEFEINDTSLSYREISGPLLPTDFMVNTMISSVPPEIGNADMNGDGRYDFIVRTADNDTHESLYLIIDSDGTLLDTLQGLYSAMYVNATALSYDFNNNGLAEILMTQTPFSGTSQDPQKTYLFEYGGTTDIEDASAVPDNYVLHQNYPNPFNPTTVISYSLPMRSHVVIKVFDIVGNEMTVLTNEEKAAGNYQIIFDGKGLSSGVYFYTMNAGKFTETKKFILMK